MKKKALFLAGLCAFGVCTWESSAMNLETVPIYSNEKDNVPTGYEEIELRGDLLYGNNPNVIVAGANDISVYIGFNQSFGNVDIKIYNSMGLLIYNTVVNTDVQQTFIIPFSSVVNGNYTVELSNANGYAEGDFIKD